MAVNSGRSLALRIHDAYPIRMAMMLFKTYEALRAAGAPDDKAREAAEEIAGFENRLAAIEADVKLLKWMLGVNLAFSLAILVILLRLLAG